MRARVTPYISSSVVSFHCSCVFFLLDNNGTENPVNLQQRMLARWSTGARAPGCSCTSVSLTASIELLFNIAIRLQRVAVFIT